MWLMKIGPDGSHLWSKRCGGTGNDVSRGLAVNGSGDVVMVGHFSGSVDFWQRATDQRWRHRYLCSEIFQHRRRPLAATGRRHRCRFCLLSCRGRRGQHGDGRQLCDHGQLWRYADQPGRGIDIFVAGTTPLAARCGPRGFGGSFDDQVYALAGDGTGAFLMTGQFGGGINFWRRLARELCRQPRRLCRQAGRLWRPRVVQALAVAPKTQASQLRLESRALRLWAASLAARSTLAAARFPAPEAQMPSSCESFPRRCPCKYRDGICRYRAQWTRIFDGNWADLWRQRDAQDLA